VGAADFDSRAASFTLKITLTRPLLMHISLVLRHRQVSLIPLVHITSQCFSWKIGFCCVIVIYNYWQLKIAQYFTTSCCGFGKVKSKDSFVAYMDV
jgi:hypothetical protein